MLWRDTVPVAQVADEAGRRVTVTLVAGRFGAHKPPAPPPSSWAARPDTDVAIWTLRLDPHARWLLPAAAPGTNRSLYFFRGRELGVSGRAVPSGHVGELRSDVDAELENGPEEAEALLLQGRPIGEPVARGGPFVMNTRDEIREAYADYQRTEFGGWPWPSHDPVHPRDERRFARLIDGRVERPA
jgi:redox-sensitive bicupin YhaK (pirin superfamily)